MRDGAHLVFVVFCSRGVRHRHSPLMILTKELRRRRRTCAHPSQSRDPATFTRSAAAVSDSRAHAQRPCLSGPVVAISLTAFVSVTSPSRLERSPDTPCYARRRLVGMRKHIQLRLMIARCSCCRCAPLRLHEGAAGTLLGRQLAGGAVDDHTHIGPGSYIASASAGPAWWGSRT